MADVPGADLVVLLQACAARAGDAVLSDVRTAIGDDIRYQDGYVFQHLVNGPCSVTDLAARLGVTQQAASKQVAGLVARQLVTRRPDPRDGRAWQLELSARGRRAVEAGRIARQRFIERLTEDLGATEVDALTAHLARLGEHTGALGHMLGRRLRPEQNR